MTARLTVVTGGSHGIGRATALRLVRRGERVVACGTDQSALESLAKDSEGRVEPLVLDITDREAVGKELSALGQIHGVIASAGICQNAGIDEDPDDAVWHRVLDVNLHGLYYTLKATAPHMTDGGRVVIVSSGLGKLGRPRYGAYTASKHAALGLMKCLAHELAPRQITVNAVCPGWVDTRMAAADVGRGAADSQVSADEYRRQAESAIPIGRFVTADEVASLIEYLASDDASGITGQAYNISGGEYFA